MTHVRDLLGEDLGRLRGVLAGAAPRFLVEAERILAETDDGDVLVVDVGGRGYVAAAAGYGTSFGDARMVAVRHGTRTEVLRPLLVDVAARSVRRGCLGLGTTVDAAEPAVRRVVESLGFLIIGAAVATWTEDSGPDAPLCHTDVWRLHYEFARRSPEGTALLPPGADVAVPGAGNPCPGRRVRPEEEPCNSD